MTKGAPVCLLLLSLSFAAIASASDVAGNALFVPIVSRTPGALGSEWRTDLVISNVSNDPAEVPFTIEFTPNDGSPSTSMSGAIVGRTSYTYSDVVNIGFGRAVAAGVVHISSPSPGARLAARARIYNVASPNGEFGQHVPGSRLADLEREHHLNGLFGTHGNRTNVGMANPWNTPVSLSLDVFDGEGARQFSGFLVLAPRQVIQINDLFAWIGKAPFPNATVEIVTSQRAYVYASTVRADSGDPIFIAAVAPGTDTSSGAIEPQCRGAAPLSLAALPAPGWTVGLQDGVNTAATASGLAQKYGFTVTSVFEAEYNGFMADALTHASIAGMRCEAAVRFIRQNAIPGP